MQIKPIKRPWTKSTTYGTRYTKPSSGFYHTSEWKQVRAAKLKLNPFCECQECAGKNIPAQMVDHIQRIEDGGSPTDMSNLQSMTNSCHAKKSASEKNQLYKAKK